MKSRDHLLRLKRFQVEERRRRVVQIETMVAEFARMAADLDREIAAEEQRSGIADPTHFRAAVARRDNLKRSVDELKGQIEEARALHEEAVDDLKKAEAIDIRDKPERFAEPVRGGSDADSFGMGRMARA